MGLGAVSVESGVVSGGGAVCVCMCVVVSVEMVCISLWQDSFCGLGFLCGGGMGILCLRICSLLKK